MEQGIALWLLASGIALGALVIVCMVVDCIKERNHPWAAWLCDALLHHKERIHSHREEERAKLAGRRG